MNHVVVRQLVERIVLIGPLALGQQALDDHRGAPGEALDLLFPLVFEGCRADHEHPLDPHDLGQDLDGRNGLDRLAQAHIVGNQASAGQRGEQGPLPLVGVELHFQ